MQDAYIIAYGRAATGKGNPKGAYAHTRADDVAAQVLKGVIDRVDGDFDPALIEDVIVGNAFPEGEQGQNIARTIALLAGLPHTVPGQTVNRYCSSGLQTIALAANSIMAGQADVDRKSTRLNSSHVAISYAVFCSINKKKYINSEL